MRFLENTERADVYYSHDGAHYEQVRFENSENMTNLRIIGCFLGSVAGSEKTEGKEIPHEASSCHRGGSFVLFQSLSRGALAVPAPALADACFSCSFMCAFAIRRRRELNSHKSLATAAAANASVA